MRNLSIALVVIALMIAAISPSPSFSLSSSSNVNLSTDWQFKMNDYNTFVTWSEKLFFDKALYTSGLLNFTTAALTAATNPSQSFGPFISASSGAIAKITAITANYVEIQETFTTGNPNLHFIYVMPSTSSPMTIPQSVLVGSAIIQQPQYFQDSDAYSRCNAPCVFQNSSNKTLIIKSGTVSPVTVQVYFPVFNGVTGGIGVGPPAITTTLPLPIIPSGLGIAVAILLVILGFGYIREKKGTTFENPRITSKPEKHREFHRKQNRTF